jgi:hypothetical protein
MEKLVSTSDAGVNLILNFSFFGDFFIRYLILYFLVSDFLLKINRFCRQMINLIQQFVDSDKLDPTFRAVSHFKV